MGSEDSRKIRSRINQLTDWEAKMIGETINIKAVEVTSSTGKQERWLHVVSHVDPFSCKK